MPAISSQPILDVVRQHAEESAILRNTRSALANAPHVKLHHLRRLDDRIAAHLDGLAVAGEFGWKLCEAALERPGKGEMFAAAERALEDKDQRRLHKLLALAEAVPESRAGLTSAFGWVSAYFLRGTITNLLASSNAFQRQMGIAACAVHRVDPGLVTARRVLDTIPMVRARAYRTAGEIGCEEAVAACAAAVRDDDPECGFWGAWASVLLGNRGTALDVVTTTALTAGFHRRRAFHVALQAMSLGASHGVLQRLGGDAEQLPWLIQGSGIAGDPKYVQWLVGHMANERTARLAGEAFTLITGADLETLKLERLRPESFESGPNDDPDDPNVEMDPDDGLPWPDPERVQNWWAANSGRFPKGNRYFMGAPVTREHCIDVLKNGYQRQRILAAHYLCLLEPGTPLFNTSAPAWRQQKLLAQMS